MNCTGWAANTTTEKWSVVVKHPCYTWTFIEAFWWGLMTITTVGYELSPKTLLGKLIGGFCALSGVFILTLPIPIVVNSFAVFYKNRLWRNEVEQKKKERTMQLAAERNRAGKLQLLKTMVNTTAGLGITNMQAADKSAAVRGKWELTE